MIYTIENEKLKVSVDTAGAQLQSVYSKTTGVEYLWQGDPAYWRGRAYNLFPFIGRMYDEVFNYEGKQYLLNLIDTPVSFNINFVSVVKVSFVLIVQTNPFFQFLN